MIELIEIELPVNTQDFDRHSTSKTQYFKGKKFIYAPILPQLEAYLNFKNVENAAMERKKFNCPTLTMDWLSKQISHIEKKIMLCKFICTCVREEVGMTGDRKSFEEK